MTRLLPQLVTASAQRFPERPAVVMDGRTLAYGELERLSNRFARSLLAHRVRAGGVGGPEAAPALDALEGDRAYRARAAAASAGRARVRRYPRNALASADGAGAVSQVTHEERVAHPVAVHYDLSTCALFARAG